MIMKLSAIITTFLAVKADGFSSFSNGTKSRKRNAISLHAAQQHVFDKLGGATDRRSLLGRIAATTALLTSSSPASATVGSLPEYQDTNMVMQGITVKISDPSQLKQMISFLEICFEFKVLRSNPDASDIWLGFGPEEMSIPKDFTLPVSSFNNYGGHASIHLRYDVEATSSYYRGDGVAPGNNIEYLQVGVPQYRVTQMVKEGGNVIDAYGFVNVVSPSGLPMRGIVGISPDPMMFCAIRCANIEESKTFYKQIGFVEQGYPYCRLGKGTGDFEPPQPKNSVYLAPSRNSMGVLLLPPEKKNKKITPNPAFGSLNLVYGNGENLEEGGLLKDPSGVNLAFQKYQNFESSEKGTRVKTKA